MPNKIFDGDRHVIEPVSLWKEYTSERTFSKYPIYLKNVPHQELSIPPILMIGEHSVLSNWGPDIQVAAAIENESSIAERLAATCSQDQLLSMNDSGIEQALLFPSFAMYIVNHSEIDAQASLDFASAYNRWLFDYIGSETDRLHGVGVISRHDPKTMVAQLETIAQFGWRMIKLRPEIINGRSLGHPDYEAFWKRCEQLGITVALHGGTHLAGSTVGTDRFTSRFGLHACSHPIEIQMAFLSLVESGVTERYPSLKFLLLEAGCSWVPYWLWRLDNICYTEFPSLIQDNIKMLPSEYFKRQFWLTIELGEPSIEDCIKTVGVDNLIYGSDFPHPDHMHLNDVNIRNELDYLTPSEIDKILYRNYKALI
ncbi:amidohydrolase family protein [Pseudoalteromonas ardens]|uniref:amidohydrolase family protein n=1 Tax=Pseudoalteromonas ardens TaxID=3048490 RepID=UPI0024C3150B|nr:amidohydrolase family protein [Pseudoalteromonas sp. R96]MDK1310606.1 amidohydrolase family protein [Pseudoalteromonas sp. R96]